MGIIVLLVVIGIIGWALSWRPYEDGAPAEPTEKVQPAEPVPVGKVSEPLIDQWTALDEHQLNRLLKETI